MSKKKNKNIQREMKIEDGGKGADNFREVEDQLKTVSKKFMKDPLTLEGLDKAYTDIVGKDKTKDKGMEIRSKSKKHEEKAIFYDIFIKPKENKIKEIRKKRNEQKGVNDEDVNQIETKQQFISNKVNEMSVNNKIETTNNSTHQQTKSITDNISLKHVHNSAMSFKMKRSEEPILLKAKSVQVKNALTDSYAKCLTAFLKDKFTTANTNEINKKNFFNQLIQIRPPEGINAVVASPLIDSKGWAPSIPSMQMSKMNTNLDDLMMRAKGGIQAGDIPKEAHMAFYLGIMNEEEKRYEEALKFYKKYFLSAKLLQDVYGTELALNRIAVLYSNINEHNQSLYYNEKHKDITTHNINGFVANYNCGICQRILGRYEESINSFNKALQMSGDENVKIFYCLGLRIIYHLLMSAWNQSVVSVGSKRIL
jgi:tetratricopeptide (TPR) repeat protein